MQGIISVAANLSLVMKPMHAEVFLDTNILVYAFGLEQEGAEWGIPFGELGHALGDALNWRLE